MMMTMRVVVVQQQLEPVLVLQEVLLVLVLLAPEGKGVPTFKDPLPLARVLMRFGLNISSKLSLPMSPLRLLPLLVASPQLLPSLMFFRYI